MERKSGKKKKKKNENCNLVKIDSTPSSVTVPGVQLMSLDSCFT